MERGVLNPEPGTVSFRPCVLLGSARVAGGGRRPVHVAMESWLNTSLCLDPNFKGPYNLCIHCTDSEFNTVNWLWALCALHD